MKETNSQENRSKINEDKWREKVKNALGEDYVDRILELGKDIETFKEFNQKVQKFIKESAQNISSSRMRKIYELIKKSKNSSDLLMAIPYIAYMVGREENKKRKEVLGELFVILKDVITKMNDEKEHLKNIKKFTEMLVAYQKLYGKD